MEVNSPIILATIKGELEKVHELLHEMEAQDHFGATSLIWAARKGHFDIVEMLVRAGANLNHQSTTGFTALTYAVHSGNQKIAEMLIQEGSHLDVPDKFGFTALTWASRNGNHELVSLLLAAGANPHHENKAKKTPKMMAQEMKHDHIVDMFNQYTN